MIIELPEFLILTLVLFAAVFAGIHWRGRRRRR
jgi:hypothetical protein